MEIQTANLMEQWHFYAATGGATSEVANAMSITIATCELIPHLNTIKAEDLS
ncbi:hypothetical protein [Micromonospora parva]|uniref:hypothetical protein n=1 Tax=Micromonospora parva TaxID=1464048 RepID=UPI0033DEFDBD